VAARRSDLSTAPPFGGAVLCGGQSSRMGRDKALLPVAGSPMAARVAAALGRAGAAEVYAVGGDVEGLGAHGLVVVPDDRPGEGPLPATLTALRHAHHPLVVVLSCDLLRPSPTAIRALVDRLGASPAATLGAVPVVAGHHQWTHVVWRRNALTVLEEAHASGARSLRRAAGHLPLLEVHDIDPRLTADADTAEDLARASAAGGLVTGSLPPMAVPEIDVAELEALRAGGAPLIDVREDDEYAAAHVPGAHLIPLGEVVDRTAEVPTDQTVYVICARGARSAKAVQHYRAQGIDAVNVAGGTLAWIDAGLPTEPAGRGAGGA
jgi:molybdopterin-guanine dinucleotide biosynthesis protein A/rhodanese-related sulfurtransferase